MRQSKVFFGWYVVGACFVVMFMGAGIGFYGFGAFINPLEAEFGWSRAEIAVGMSIVSVIQGLGGPLIGRWTDTFGPRKVMISGAVVMGATLIALYGMSSLWHFYAIFFISALGRVGLSNIPVGATIGNWFRRQRGVAMGIAATGIGVGGLIMSPLISFMISTYGWRWSTVALGLATLIITIPIVAIFVRRTPAEVGLRPLGDTGEEEQDGPRSSTAELTAVVTEGLTFQQSIRTTSFWLISISLLLVFVGQGSILLHVIPYFIDQGESPQIAATILALIAGVGAIGKFGMGYLGDKIPSRFAMSACFVSQVIGYAFLLLPKSPVTVPAFVLFYGLGMGGVVTLWGLITAETFGIRSLGTILGGLGVLPTISMAGGPVLAGYIFDTTRSYSIAFLLFLVTAVAGTLFMFFAKPEIGAEKDARRVVA